MKPAEPVKFLLVDDLEENLLALEATLRRPGLQLLKALNGSEALELLLVHDFALAIVDVQMPGMDGFELAELMRGTGRTMHVPIMFLTAGAIDERRRFRGYEHGAVDFLFKPIEPEILQSKANVFFDLYTQRQELMRQRDALRESETRFRAAQQTSPDGFMILRSVRNALGQIEDFQWVYTNPASEILVNRKASDMIGRRMLELFPGTRTEGLFDAYTQVVETGEPWQREFPYYYDGVDRHFRATAVKVEDGFAVSFADVTAAWRAADELAKAKRIAEAANAAKDRFLATLSHELRTPLSPVRISVSSWEKDPQLPADLLQDLGMIRRNVDLVCRLIDDMLDLNRIIHGKVVLQSRLLNVDEEIDHAIKTLSADAAAKEISLTFKRMGDNVYVSGDAARIQQILWNLVRNALKFTPAHGAVTVRSHVSPGLVTVEVQDTGVGIKPEVLHKIFNAFEQGGTEVTRQFGGLGLGLSISRMLAEMHGGKLTAASDGPGKGATFSLQLPTVAAPVPSAQGDAKPAPNPVAADGVPLRILLVEDHEDTARVMKRLLASAGYDVMRAGNVSDGLRLAEKERFDLLISDIGLPDGTGHELMQQVIAHHPALGIALTGYGMEEDVQRSYKSGFRAHLTKPVNMEELIATIQRILASEGAGSH